MKFRDLVAILAFTVIILIPVYIIWGSEIDHFTPQENMLLGGVIGLWSGICSYKWRKHHESE